MKTGGPFVLMAGQGAPPDAGMLVVALVGMVLVVAADLYGISVCLRDLAQRTIVFGASRQTWTLIIVLGGPVGQIFYWLYGRGPN
jgi:hypothetical protein